MTEVILEQARIHWVCWIPKYKWIYLDISGHNWHTLLSFVKVWYTIILDGVGPVDNRPSTDKLHHFVKKKKRDTCYVTCDTWHVTRDTWHVTRDTWNGHVTHDTWHVWGVNILSKFQLPSSYRLWFKKIWDRYYEDLEEKDEWLN